MAEKRAIKRVATRFKLGAPPDIRRAAKKRVAMLPDTYYAQRSAQARAASFSVAGLAALDQVQAVKDSIDAAIASGQGFRDWKRDVLAGKVPGIGELTPARLENIFRTNLQTAYSRGLGEWQRRNARTHPYLLYDAVNDSRTRPSHRVMDGTILPQDHPWWSVHYPPNGFMCRCRAVALTAQQASRLGGVTAAPPDGPDAAPDPGWDGDPRAQPRRGEMQALRRRQGKSALPDKARELAVQASVPPPDDPDAWVEVGGQLGSNPGALYQAPDGARYYVKFYDDPGQARAEVAALAIYRAAGIETLDARIIERAMPGKSQRGVAIATRWRDDLEVLRPNAVTLQQASEVAEVHQVSAMIKNWDAFGLTGDNIKVARGTGRLVVVDAGGSFMYRARGQRKPFTDEPEVPELETLRDPSVSPAASTALFHAALNGDVYLELRAARTVLPRITDQAIDDALEVANLPRDKAVRLRAALIARRNAMMDRYDFAEQYVPASLREAVEEVRRIPGLSMSRVGVFMRGADGAYRSNLGVQTEGSSSFISDVEAFEKWINDRARVEFGMQPTAAAEWLKNVFRNWSSSSSSQEGALLKLWAFRRFGVAPNFHNDRISDLNDLVLREASGALLSGMSLADALRLIDYEYAFNQHLLRRLHGWERVQLYRRVIEPELRMNLRDGWWHGNSVASATVDPEIFESRKHRVDFSGWRAETVLKVFQQGSPYLSYQREREYVIIGRPFRLRNPIMVVIPGSPATPFKPSWP